MSETELPAWADVATAADRLELASTPAELHGALCGWLAAGGADQPGWIATVMADPGLPTPAPGDALDQLRTTSAKQLGDADFGFELLLPDEEGWPTFLAGMSGLRRRAPWLFDAEGGRRQLLRFFAVHDLGGFGIEGRGGAIAAAAALLGYVEETQKQRLPHLTAIALESAGALTFGAL